MPKIQVSKSQINIMKKKNNFNEEIRNIHKLILKQKTDSKNEAYDKLLKEKKLRRTIMNIHLMIDKIIIKKKIDIFYYI